MSNNTSQLTLVERVEDCLRNRNDFIAKSARLSRQHACNWQAHVPVANRSLSSRSARSQQSPHDVTRSSLLLLSEFERELEAAVNALVLFKRLNHSHSTHSQGFHSLQHAKVSHSTGNLPEEDVQRHEGARAADAGRAVDQNGRFVRRHHCLSERANESGRMRVLSFGNVSQMFSLEQDLRWMGNAEVWPMNELKMSNRPRILLSREVEIYHHPLI